MPDRPESAQRAAPRVIEPGSARWFAWLYAGEERDLLGALLEIEQEIESSLRPGLDHQVAHLRLVWWHEECERFAQGRPLHPATRRLHEVAMASERTVELTGLIEATAWDLASATPERRGELEKHCTRWARTMIMPLARQTAAASAALEGGAALRETELLLRLASDAHQGRLRLPLDELDGIGVQPRALASLPWPPALAEHVRARLLTLRQRLHGVLRGVDVPSLHAWSAVLSASAHRLVRALPRRPHARRLEGLADAVHAWRAARAALKGAVRLP